MDIMQAIMFIMPQAKWHFEGGNEYEHLVWDDGFYPKPSKEMLQEAFHNSMKVFAEGHDYRLQRLEHYPTAEQQLAMIFDLGIEGWRERIEAVKAKYPKP